MTMVQPQPLDEVKRTEAGKTMLTSSGKSVVVKELGKSFGDVQAVRGISFEVGRGEVVALLGPNGAGKTTTVDMLSTLTKPDRGSASIAGHDVVSDPAAVRRSIMLTGQQVALDDVLTGRENLVLFGRLQGLGKSAARARAEELLTEFDLQYASERRVGTYSGGMRRRIDIACGLVVRPEVVFLDEPTTGLDPRSRQVIWDLVANFKLLGISTLLTTQYLEEADALSDRIIVIDNGEIVAEGTADELKERTGGSYCEIVPRDLHDIPAVVAALGPLLPEKNRAAALASESERIAMPAPKGPNTLVEALAALNAANIELRDIALRRPSLDDVFLALTSDNTGSPTSNGARPAADDQQPDIAPDSDDEQPSPGGRGRSWLSTHARTLIVVAVCAVAVTAASVFALNRNSAPAGNSPTEVRPPAPAPALPPAARPAAPAVRPAAPTARPAAPTATEVPMVPPPSARPQRSAGAATPTALPTTRPAVAVSPSQPPTASPAAAVGTRHGPPTAPPGPVAAPAAAAAPLDPPDVPEPLPPDPLQAVLSPLLGGLP
jgi:ABC-2 type transport system ATP-binding protein